MEEDSFVKKILKMLLFCTFLASLYLNIYQNHVIIEQEVAIKKLFRYEQGFLKAMELIGANSEQSEHFLKQNTSK